MQEFHLETIGPSGDCAVLQVTGEIDVYTAAILRERIRDLVRWPLTFTGLVMLL